MVNRRSQIVEQGENDEVKAGLEGSGEPGCFLESKKESEEDEEKGDGRNAEKHRVEIGEEDATEAFRGIGRFRGGEDAFKIVPAHVLVGIADYQNYGCGKEAADRQDEPALMDGEKV